MATERDAHALAQAQASVAESDPVVIIYTSGTTGTSKGATHGHRVLMNAANTARALHMERGDCKTKQLQWQAQVERQRLPYATTSADSSSAISVAQSPRSSPNR